jgi:hypothetical protein
MSQGKEEPLAYRDVEILQQNYDHWRHSRNERNRICLQFLALS